MKCGLRNQAAGVKSRPSGDMDVIIKNVPWLRSMNRQGEKSLDGKTPPRIFAMAARSGDSWTGGMRFLSRWWEKAKGALHRVKYPFWSRLAPRAGLEPATSRLQVPRFFNRAWTISSPAYKIAGEGVGRC
jgi:hypothetical protein